MMMRMRKTLFAVLALLGAFLLGGCSVSKEDDALARQLIEALHAGDYAALSNKIDPEYRTTQTAEALPKMRALLDLGELKEMHQVGYWVRGGVGSGPSYRDASYEIEFSKGWVLAQFRFYRNGATCSVQSFQLTPLTKSLESAHAFTLTGKSTVQYAFLFMVIMEPLFMLATLIACIRTRLKRKPLWCLLVLVGVMRFSMNWTTGQMGWQQMSVALLGSSGLRAGPAAPWVLSFSVPMGAILFLLKRRSLRQPDTVAPPPLPPSLPSPPPSTA